MYGSKRLHAHLDPSCLPVHVQFVLSNCSAALCAPALLPDDSYVISTKAEYVGRNTGSVLTAAGHITGTTPDGNQTASRTDLALVWLKDKECGGGAQPELNACARYKASVGTF